MKEKKNVIVSMSLKPEVLVDLDRMSGELGFSGRSETIRAGINSLKSEQKERAKLKGKINATLAVVHEHAKGVSMHSHEYQNIISSHIHNHLDNHKCLDIFVLSGNVLEIRKLVESFQKMKGVEQARLTVC